MLGRLGLVDEHECSGAKPCYLAHYLHTNTAGRTGYQHAFAGKLFTDRLQVHANLGARQQVLNGHLFQAHTAHLVLADSAIVHAGFCGFVCHIDFAACVDEQILQLLITTELLFTQRAHEDALDTFFLDDSSQVVVQCIDVYAHEFFIANLGFVRDETTQIKLRRALGADILRKAYSTEQCAIDEHARHIGVGVGDVEHDFYHNSESPHQQSRNG